MTSRHMERVVAAFRAERTRQIANGFTLEHDIGLHPAIFSMIAARHVGLGVQDGGLVNRKIWERQFVRLGAIAMAALEAYYEMMARLEPPVKVADHTEKGPDCIWREP